MVWRRVVHHGVRALLVALLTVFGVAGVGTVAAHAAGVFPAADVCQGDAPEAENPLANGPLSTVMPRPAVIPKQGDPWNPADHTTIMEQYGTAGMTWATYDTGCGVGTEIMPNLWTGLANFMTLAPRFFTAAAASIANWVLAPDTWLHALDGPVDAVSSALVGSFGNVWMPLVLVIAASVVVWQAVRRARLGKALTALAFVLLGVCLLGVAAHAPSRLAGQLDGVVAGSVSEALGAGGMSADQRASLGARAIDPMWEAVAYDRWLEGMFGSATSKSAQTYGPRLFKAQALTWSEAVSVEGDAAKTKTLIDAKKVQWRAAAQEFKDADPSGYAYLTGTKGPDRVGTALVAIVVAACCVPFVLVALGMTAGGYIVLRFMAALLPVFAVMVVVMHSVARTLGRIVVAVLVNTLVFAAAAAAVITLSGAVLRSDLNMMLAIVVVGMLSFICWVMLRPFRTLTRIVSNPGSGFQAALETPGSVASGVKDFAVKAGASFAGNNAANKAAEDREDEDEGAGESEGHGKRPELRESDEPGYAQIRDEPGPGFEPPEYVPVGDPPVSRWDLDMSKYKQERPERVVPVGPEPEPGQPALPQGVPAPVEVEPDDGGVPAVDDDDVPAVEGVA